MGRNVVLPLVVILALPGLVRAEPEGWTRVTCDGVSALFPAATVLVTKVEEEAGARIETQSHTAARGGRQYTVSITRVPAELGRMTAEELLAKYTRGLPDGSEATIRQEPFRGYPGVTIEGRVADARVVHQRAFVNEGRLIALSVEWSSGEGQPLTVRDFEESLRLGQSDRAEPATPTISSATSELQALKVELFQHGGWIMTIGGLALAVGAAVFLSLRLRLFEV